MSANLILFVIISVIGLLMALGTVLARNLVHAALFLVAFFFVIACQFVLLEADFLAAIQVLVYIGAVAILLMFGIMLTRNILGDETTTVRTAARIPAAVVGLGVLAVLCFGIYEQTGQANRPAWKDVAARPPVGPPAATAPGTPGVPLSRETAVNDMGRVVGIEMMTRFVVPFEVAGLLLTAALVGAVAVAQLHGADEEPKHTMASAAGQPGASNGNGHAAVAPVVIPASASKTS